MEDSEGIIELNRTKSEPKFNEMEVEKSRCEKLKPDTVAQDSILTCNSDFTDYTGFIHWAILLMVFGVFVLLLENTLEYGFQGHILQWIYLDTKQDSFIKYGAFIIFLFFSAIPILFCLLTERTLSKKIISNTHGMVAHIVNLLLVVLMPLIASYVMGRFSIVGTIAATSVYGVLFLKLWSYVEVNMWYRERVKLFKNKECLSVPNVVASDGKNTLDLVQYPNNLTVKDLSYFVLAPTLCYELNFRKTSRIRKWFLLRCTIEIVLGIQLMLALVQQCMVPVIKNSFIPFSSMPITEATEKLLRLAIPNHLAGMCFFYIVFHSLLNLIGELLYFADRNFYSDWWNATNMDTFWSIWNMVVHQWCVQHLRLPLIAIRYGRLATHITLFFVYALLQEYMVSLPLRTFKIWLFMGMVVQIPFLLLSHIIENLHGPGMGNVIVWMSLLIGQPMFLMMYFHDYAVENIGK